MERNLYRVLVEESSDITTIVDSDGTITYVNPSITRTLGYEPEDLVGEVGYEYQHPDDRDAVADAIETIQANPDDVHVSRRAFGKPMGRGAGLRQHYKPESTIRTSTAFS